MDLEDLTPQIPWKQIVGVAHRFYTDHLLDIELHTDASDTYCFVHDSERYPSGRVNYHIQFKATIDLRLGKKLDLQTIHFVIKDTWQFGQVVFSAQTAPTNVRTHFRHMHNGWMPDSKKQNWRGTQGQWQVRGVAMSSEPFSNKPDGPHDVLMLLELKRFLVLVPCRFACMGAGSSTLKGRMLIKRISGRRVNPVAIAKQYPWNLGQREQLTQRKLAILDFDFLPYGSPFIPVPVKKYRFLPSL